MTVHLSYLQVSVALAETVLPLPDGTVAVIVMGEEALLRQVARPKLMLFWSCELLILASPVMEMLQTAFCKLV